MSLLPSAKTKRKDRLSDFDILVHGAPKIGKTEWASTFPDVLFLATESGHKDLEVWCSPIDSWVAFKGIIVELRGGGNQYRNLCIDTIDNLFELCKEYTCELLKVKDLSDVDYGKGYDKARHEFHRVMQHFLQLPYGKIFISHSKEETISSRTGDYTRTCPSLSNKGDTLAPRSIIEAACDFILHFDVLYIGKDQKRVIYANPSKHRVAGGRVTLPDEMELNLAVFASEFKKASIKKHGAGNVVVPGSDTTEEIDENNETEEQE